MLEFLGRDLVVLVVEPSIRGAASPVGAARCSRSRRIAGSGVRHQPTTLQYPASPCRHAMPEEYTCSGVFLKGIRPRLRCALPLLAHLVWAWRGRADWGVPPGNTLAESFPRRLLSPLPSRSSVPPSQRRSSTSSVTRHTNTSSVSVYLGSPVWRARSCRIFKVDGCIPQTQHGNLSIVWVAGLSGQGLHGATLQSVASTLSPKP